MTTQRSLFDAPEQLLADRARPGAGARGVEFSVHGIPATQGSGRALHRRAGPPVVVHDDKRLLPWRHDVGRCALAARAEQGLGGVLLDGPVRMVLRFRLPRRKSWGKRTRLEDVAVRPDFDKLTRAIGDALTNVLYSDDGQVTTSLILKRPCRIGEPPGVDVAVGPDFEAV